MPVWGVLICWLWTFGVCHSGNGAYDRYSTSDSSEYQPLLRVAVENCWNCGDCSIVINCQTVLKQVITKEKTVTDWSHVDQKYYSLVQSHYPSLSLSFTHTHTHDKHVSTHTNEYPHTLMHGNPPPHTHTHSPPPHTHTEQYDLVGKVALSKMALGKATWTKSRQTGMSVSYTHLTLPTRRTV